MIARQPSAELDAAMFDECERIVLRNLPAFKDALVALRAIQRCGISELGRRGYTSFEDYCGRRLGWGDVVHLVES